MNPDSKVFGCRISGLGSTRIGNMPSRCGFSWFLEIEWTDSTHFDAVVTSFLPFSLPSTWVGMATARWADAGCGTALPPGWGGAARDAEAGRAQAWLGRGERRRMRSGMALARDVEAGRTWACLGRGERTRGCGVGRRWLPRRGGVGLCGPPGRAGANRRGRVVGRRGALRLWLGNDGRWKMGWS